MNSLQSKVFKNDHIKKNENIGNYLTRVEKEFLNKKQRGKVCKGKDLWRQLNNTKHRCKKMLYKLKGEQSTRKE